MSTVDRITVKASQFQAYQSVKDLQKLAASAPDLTAPGFLSPERLGSCVVESCGFKLLYGTERVDDRVLSALESLAGEAAVMDKMQQMQDGAVLNCIDGFDSEDRAVLHTATRDVFDNPNTGEAAVDAAGLAKREHQKLRSFLDKTCGSNTFTDMIVVGIGGSDLGPRALYLALEKFRKPSRRVHFIANVDPDDAAHVLDGIDLSKTLVVVISKSGTTLETLTNETLVRTRFIKAGIKPEKHFVAVTGEGSPMDDRSKYLESFYIWDFVGGRYSATSMVGGVMLGFALGYDVFIDFLAGANAMDKAALNPKVSENLPLFSALLGVWNRNFLGCPTVAVIPYSQALWRFPAHLQQCDMESNGKQIDKIGKPVDYETGPIIWGEPGTNGQHSFFQLIHQGTTVVPVEFIGFKDSQYGEDMDVKGTVSQEKLLSNLFAQSLALAQGHASDNPNKHFPGNRPSRTLLAKQLTPWMVGALLSYYENKIAFQGFLWNINSFDQEGVQLGKVLADKIIDLFAARRSGGPAGSFPEGQALLKHLDSL